jgi:MFS family permease
MAAMRSRPDRILVWMCVLIALNQLGFGGIVPVLALYSRSFGLSQSAIGVAIAVYGLARLLVAMPAGRLADDRGAGRRSPSEGWCGAIHRVPSGPVEQKHSRSDASLLWALGSSMLGRHRCSVWPLTAV